MVGIQWQENAWTRSRTIYNLVVNISARSRIWKRLETFSSVLSVSPIWVLSAVFHMQISFRKQPVKWTFWRIFPASLHRQREDTGENRFQRANETV
jgi:hypothetical protein